MSIIDSLKKIIANQEELPAINEQLRLLLELKKTRRILFNGF